MSRFIKNLFNFNKNDRIILGISFAVLFFASVGLYFDLNRSVGSGSGKKIGVLRIKNNIAQRKFDEQVIWENLENEIPLFNNDSIRTGELSAATIVLNDETQIELDESSMIVLSIDEDNMNIDFVSGSIQAKKSKDAEGSTEAELTITSKDKTIKIDDSDIQLNKGDKEELVVNVKRGQASIKTKDGKEQNINENERASLNNEGKIEIKKISLLPQSPASGSSIFSQGRTQAVNFSWNKLENNQGVLLEISNRRSFGSSKIKRQVNQNTFSTSLEAGIYYWRISALNQQTKKREFSEIRKFSILQNSPMQLHSPGPGSNFNYVNEPPSISFSWSNNALASGYTLLVAKNRNLTDPVYNSTISNTGISIKLPEGKYFWKVVTKSNLTGASSSSPVSNLVITKREKTPAPFPIQPVNSKVIPRTYFEKSGVVFNWKSSSEIKNTRVEISNSSNFSNILHSQISQNNFIKIKKNLNPGSYFWRMIATDASGNQTEYSQSARFQVGETQKIELIRPGNNESFDVLGARTNGIVLNWKETQVYGNFRVEISKNANFSTIAKTATVTGLTYNSKGLGKGTWYWRVKLLDGNTVLSSSDPGKFIVSDSFLAPVIISPANNSVIDLTNRNNLFVSWKNSNGAVYYNVSFRYNNKTIMSRKINGTNWNIQDFSKLQRGKITLSVQACREQGNPACTPESQSSFLITLKNPPVPVIEADEEVFVIEDE